MNAMIERDIDRLVDGELTESERRDLLLRLDLESQGWRRCALAFLEAQCLRAALVEPAPTPISRSIVNPSVRPIWKTSARRTALAASVALAFLLGWNAHDAKPERAQAPPLEPLLEAPRMAKQPANPISPVAFVDPVVERLQQRGFSAEKESRLVPVELADGRRVAMPVQVVRLQYVGGRTY
jgi:hypothetical protein